MVPYSIVLVLLVLCILHVAYSEYTLAERVAKVIQDCNGNSDYMMTQTNYLTQLRGYLFDQGVTDKLVQKYVIDMSRKLSNGVTAKHIMTRLQFIADTKPSITESNLGKWATLVTAFDAQVTAAIKAKK